MSLSNTLRRNTVAGAATAAIAVGVMSALFAAGAAAEAVPAQPTIQETNRDLAAARAASAKYHRVEAAIADGFVEPHGHEGPPTCVALPDGSGGMGYHFVNPQRMGDGHIDVREPEVLLYEKDDDGRFRLTGVEYVGSEGDALFGHTFTPTPAGPALHAWLWKHNPSGMFADWNPSVGC